MSSSIGMGLAFLAGLVSFLSPCVLPLVPIYLAQLVGQSVYQSSEQHVDMLTRVKTFLHATLFVGGFTITFVALGATASALGSLLLEYRYLLRQIGGIILIVMGLHLSGLLPISFLYRQKRFTFKPTRPSYQASLLFGVIFAIAWTPCVGPILSSILAMAASTAMLQQGVVLLLIYSLGLGVPFLLLGLGLNQASSFLKRLKPHLGKIETATGIIMIIAGILVFLNIFDILNQYFNVGLLFNL